MKASLAVALTCLGISMSYAQTPKASPVATPRPGVVSNGRFLGFVPRHERLQREKSLHRLTNDEERALTLAAPTTSSQVKTASYFEYMPAAEPDSGVQQASFIEPSCECGQAICSPTCGQPMFWGQAEYLYWTTKGVDLPTLATTSIAGTSQTNAGVLGQDPTSTLFGGNESHDDGRSGGRFTLGMWLDPSRTTGLEVTYTGLSDDTDSFAGATANFPILARPFFNLDLNEQDSRLIAFEDLVDGNLAINSSTDFDTLEVLFRRPQFAAFNAKGTFLLGYRRASLDDLIRITESTESLDAATLGTTFDLFDEFATENEFHGVEFGLEYSGTIVDCWSMSLLAKVALGNTSSRVNVAGQTTTTDADLVESIVNAGLLAQESNIGTFDDDKFSTLSEFGVKLSRDLNQHVSLNIGYTFLLWTDIARAAEQIDTTINPTQIPPATLTGEARPESRFVRDDFWAQGISGGLEFRY